MICLDSVDLTLNIAHCSRVDFGSVDELSGTYGKIDDQITSLRHIFRD